MSTYTASDWFRPSVLGSEVLDRVFKSIPLGWTVETQQTSQNNAFLLIIHWITPELEPIILTIEVRKVISRSGILNADREWKREIHYNKKYDQLRFSASTSDINKSAVNLVELVRKMV